MSGKPVECYQHFNGINTSYTGVPCGNASAESPYTQCCRAGAICLSRHFCFSLEPDLKNGAVYIGGCTDPSLADTGACSDRCGKSSIEWHVDFIHAHARVVVNGIPTLENTGHLPVTNVIFDPKTNLWACCSGILGGSILCATPTNETFADISPEELFSSAGLPVPTAGAFAPSNFSAPSTATFSSTAPSSSATVGPASQTLPAGPDDPMPRGRAAGISVGASVGSFLLVGAVILLLCRFKRQRRSTAERDLARPPAELGTTAQSLELDGNEMQPERNRNERRPTEIDAVHPQEMFTPFSELDGRCLTDQKA